MLLLTLDGFSPAALSCYGSSWNRTEAIDSLAAIGTILDRVVTPVTDPLWQIERWLAARIFAGDVTVITDEERIGELPSADEIGELILMPPREDGVADAIEDTGLATLVAVATEQLADNPNVWLHSRFLTRCWDAPRELFPLEYFDDDDFEPLDPSETIEREMQAPSAVRSSVPMIFDSWQPPQETILAGDDPDRIMAWMRTYGCQIRLVDAMVGLLAELAAEAGQTSMIVCGTSGFSLGQNGSIGHRTGPLRSCHLHVPMIAAGLRSGDRIGRHPQSEALEARTLGFGAGIRDGRVRSADRLPELAASMIAAPNASPLTPEQWAARTPDAAMDSQPDGSIDAGAVFTRVGQRDRAVSTEEWFYVESGAAAEGDVDTEAGEQDSPSIVDKVGHLFLKPDDLNDANDVARLKPKTAEMYQAGLVSANRTDLA